MCPIYDFQCISCLHKFEDIVKFDDRDKPGVTQCPICSHLEVQRFIPAPHIAQVSYPDGYKRPGWVDLKEAAKLEIERANKGSLDLKERSKLSSEMKRLKRDGGMKSAEKDRRDAPGMQEAVDKSTNAKLPNSVGEK